MKHLSYEHYPDFVAWRELADGRRLEVWRQLTGTARLQLVEDQPHGDYPGVLDEW